MASVNEVSYMKKENRTYIVLGILVATTMLGYLIFNIFNNKNEKTSINDPEKGSVGVGVEIEGDEAEDDTGIDPLERNPELRVTFLDRYKLGDVIPPDCMPNICGIMQTWLDKAFENDKLNYTITLDEGSIEQNDIYAAFGFHVEEFPEYEFRYAHYYGTDEVLITSPQFEKLRFPRDE